MLSPMVIYPGLERFGRTQSWTWGRGSQILKIQYDGLDTPQTPSKGEKSRPL